MPREGLRADIEAVAGDDGGPVVGHGVGRVPDRRPRALGRAVALEVAAVGGDVVGARVTEGHGEQQSRHRERAREHESLSAWADAFRIAGQPQSGNRFPHFKGGGATALSYGDRGSAPEAGLEISLNNVGSIRVLACMGHIRASRRLRRIRKSARAHRCRRAQASPGDADGREAGR